MKDKKKLKRLKELFIEQERLVIKINMEVVSLSKIEQPRLKCGSEFTSEWCIDNAITYSDESEDYHIKLANVYKKRSVLWISLQEIKDEIKKLLEVG